MKRTCIYILSFVAAVLGSLTACQQEIFEPISDVPEGYVKISFGTNASEFVEVDTRSVDPDGGGVNNMVLFCFDAYGVFITTVEADVTPDNSNPSDLKGTFTATIPESTAIIHFVGNQNHEALDQTRFYNKSEAAAMEQLEASSGRMIYWARKKFNVTPPEGTTMSKYLNDQLKEETVKLIRNHALITVNHNNMPSDFNFVVDGMAVYNSHAFGTACPWHPIDKFDYTWPTPSDGKDFVTIPANKAKLSDIDRTTRAPYSRYVYEHENTLEDPISVIISGKLNGATSQTFYRVMMLDTEGEPIKIRRNHHYTINIEGALEHGRATFNEALDAPATNNIWVSISDDIKEVRDNDFALAVTQTAYILDQRNTIAPNNTLSVGYTLEKLSGTGNLSAGDRPEVEWLEGNNVGYNTLDHDEGNFVINGKNGTGTIGVTLLPMAEGVNKQEGTLLIKKGRLFRRVKIITVRTMEFLPAWASAEVYGGSSADNFTPANVTVMFTIPDDCPEEIFPFNVMLSCNKLDVRFIAGSKDAEGNVLYEDFTLPIVRKGEEGYGEDVGSVKPDEPVSTTNPAIGYKYAFEVTGPGVQRVYMRSSMFQDDGAATTVKIEAPFFESVTKEVTFKSNQRTILPVMHSIEGYATTGQPLGNETVYYILVPQKKNAEVEFGMKLASSSSSVALGAEDEFLIYSSSLVIPDIQNVSLDNDRHHYTDNTVTDGCEYYQVPRLIWGGSSNGRMMAFRPANHVDETAGKENGYKLRFKTNKAKSEEIVRMTSIPFWGHVHPAGYSPFTGKSVFKNLTRFEGLTELTNASMQNFENYEEKTPEMLKDDGTKKYPDGPYCYGYRSAIFELSNYNPFRFGAIVTFEPRETDFNESTLTGLRREFGDGYYKKDANGDYAVDASGNRIWVEEIPAATDHTSDEVLTEMDWPYRPDAEVDIAIDVTSFGGSDNKSVDPFGSQFDIYIDAPMLVIDNSRYPASWKNAVTVTDQDGKTATVDKFRADETTPGRFIYTVAADERAFAAAHTADFTEARIDDVQSSQAPAGSSYTGHAQTDDRRTLPFKVNGIVSQGEIKVTSDKDMVVFYDKTFRVNNVSRNMHLTYNKMTVAADGTVTYVDTYVPNDAFVSFELKKNHNRIGVITMKQTVEQNRNCSLRLRAEYDYSWEGDDIIIRFQDDDGTVYTNEAKINELNNLTTKDYFDLAYLFANPSVQLTVPPAEDNL